MSQIINSQKNRLIVGLALVALITAVNAYQNREAYSGNTEYTGYGFSFPYREDMTLYVTGNPAYGPEASEFAGAVVVATPSFDEGFFEIVVEWATLQDVQPPEELMDRYITDLEVSANVTFTGSIGPRYIQRDSHDVAYWILNGTQRGTEFMVVEGVWVERWEPLRTNRVYIIGIITPRHRYKTDELDTKFTDFIESFKSPV